MTLEGVRTQLINQTRVRAEAAVRKMTDDLKREAPVDTGELKRKTGVSIVSVSRSLIKAEAVIDVPYGAYVVYGTSAHVISGKSKPLTFNWPKVKRVVSFWKVNHPETAANDFFERITSRWARYLN